MKKISLSFILALSAVMPLLAWDVLGVPIQNNLRHGEWELIINGANILVVFDRVGQPATEKDRLNQITILANNKERKEKPLFHLEARVTEDISIPEKWTYHISDTSGKEYALIILRYCSDGEDPTLKPIFIVTDGKATEVKKYEFDERYCGSGKSDILELFSKISKEPVDQKMREAVDNIILESK